jgi:hypothetical protein
MGQNYVAHTDDRQVLARQAGIVAGTLSEFADALQTTPERVLARIDFPLLVDTATNKAREDHDRPTDPQLRSLAMTTDQFARLSAAIVTDLQPA